MIALLLLAILPPEPVSPHTVSAQMEGSAERAAATLLRARALAIEMFEPAGVRLEWCERAGKCSRWDDRIIITLARNAPAHLAPSVRAEAQVFQGRNISIYLDRLPPTAPSALWAHVLVHEITHLLHGADYHAPIGIMKAHWTHRDLAAMQVAPLPFTDLDVHLIHQGLAARRERRVP